VVDVEHTVEVVDLVLEGLGQQVGRLLADLFPVGIAPFGGHRDGTLDVPVIAGNAQARLSDLPLAGFLDDLRVDEHHVVLLGRGNDDDTHRHANLVGRQADAGGGMHRLAHVLDELLN